MEFYLGNDNWKDVITTNLVLREKQMLLLNELDLEEGSCAMETFKNLLTREEKENLFTKTTPFTRAKYFIDTLGRRMTTTLFNYLLNALANKPNVQWELYQAYRSAGGANVS